MMRGIHSGQYGPRSYTLSALLVLLALAASGNAFALTSSGYDAARYLSFTACSNWAGFRVDEHNQNDSQLNATSVISPLGDGDSDFDDKVVHILNLGTNTAVNLGLDGTGPLLCRGDWFAVGVGEAGQNATSLNGDGDAADTVLMIYNASTGFVKNLGLAVQTLRLTADSMGTLRVYFSVPEAMQGSILNGDGDMADEVLHVWAPVCDAASMAPGTPCTSDLDVACTGGACGVTTNASVAVMRDFQAIGDTAALRVPEGAQNTPAIDLNGDGDTSDEVLHFYDFTTNTVTNVGRQSKEDILFEDYNGDGNGDIIAFRVKESLQGLSSLNSDLDRTDQIAHLYCDPAAGLPCAGVVNVGLDARGYNISGDYFVFASHEGHEPTVTNGDPDRHDEVVQVYQISTASLVSTGFAHKSRLEISGTNLVFAVPEAKQNKTDLNGDGDHSDLVVHVYDMAGNSMTSTNLAVKRCDILPKKPTEIRPSQSPDCFAVSGTSIIVQVNERKTNKTDLNGDGDISDSVVHEYAIGGGATNTGMAVSSQASGIVFGSGIAAFRASERFQGQDLNGDGDLKDFVMCKYDLTSNVLTVIPAWADEFFAATGTTVVFRTLESGPATEGQNADLNLDGDQLDRVLQYE